MTMTISTFAVDAGRTPVVGAEYRPGVCNIGPEEIARRRRAGHFGVVATIVALVVLVAIDAPPLARALVAIPAIMAASGYLQAWFKFCAGFGSRGIFNFGPLGQTQAVADDAARALDRAQARRIGLAAIGIGVAVGAVAVLLPV
jgi:ferric-dicitrate binding protein FerR (iron transport regulator)